MKYVRNTLWVGQVWLTAVMTVVAGMPHVACLCPNGNLKPFCLASTCGAAGCCCGGACCTGGSPEGLSPELAPEVSCCCCADAEPQCSQASDGSRQIGNAGCTKTLAQSRVLAVRPQKVNLTEATPQEPFQPVDFAPVDQPDSTPAHRSSRPLQVPPPTDRVILLQHFLV
jgi:hypothetical protein